MATVKGILLQFKHWTSRKRPLIIASSEPIDRVVCMLRVDFRFLVHLELIVTRKGSGGDNSRSHGDPPFSPVTHGLTHHVRSLVTSVTGALATATFSSDVISLLQRLPEILAEPIH